MKKLACALLVIFGLTFAPGAAMAKDNTGRIGVGADTTLGYSADALAPGEPGTFQIPGLSVVYQTSKFFAVQLIISSNITTGTISTTGADDIGALITNVSVGARGIINIAITEDVNLGLPVGVTIINRTFGTDAEGDDGASALYLAFEVGMRPEWFVTNWFSIHTQVGFTLSIIPPEADIDDPKGITPFNGGGVNVNIFGAANLLGNAGFTFWF